MFIYLGELVLRDGAEDSLATHFTVPLVYFLYFFNF